MTYFLKNLDKVNCDSEMFEMAIPNEENMVKIKKLPLLILGLIEKEISMDNFAISNYLKNI